MLKLSLLIASAAAFQPRSTKVQPKTVQNFGMLDGLFKKSEADVTESILPSRTARSFTAVPPFTSLTASRQLAVSSQQVGTRQSSTKTFARRPLRLLAGVSRLLSSQTKSVPHR